jgi:hypothetical protein
MPTGPTPATDGKLAVSPFLLRACLIAPITLMSCHSQPESANDLFSTLTPRVQAASTHPQVMQYPSLRHAKTRHP